MTFRQNRINFGENDRAYKGWELDEKASYTYIG
jgi:hypothetical protein